MKKIVYSLLCCCFSLLLISAYLPNVKRSAKQQLIAFGVMNEEPVLPATPYNYQLDADELDEFMFLYRFPIDMEGVVASIRAIDNDVTTLGRVLFYDKMLSSNGKISCGSCHIQSASFADTVALSQGTMRKTKRNSSHLNDILWAGDPDLFWDKKEGTIKEMVRLPLMDENEVGFDTSSMIAMMNTTTYYPELFEKAYGDATMTEDRILEAIQQFVISISDTKMSSIDSVYMGHEPTLNRDAQLQEGFELYSNDCFECHASGMYDIPNNNGLDLSYADKGAGESREDEEENWDDVFKTPHLRNIAFTAPYMHDGRYKTLEEVVNFYSDSIQAHEKAMFVPVDGFAYNERQKEALVAFLKTIKSEDVLTDPKWSDPFEPQVVTSLPELANLKIQIYPNPGTEAITLEWLPQQAVDHLQVRDQNGRLMQDIQIAGQEKIQLNVAAFAPGTYFIQAQGKDRLSGQFVVLPH